MGSDHRFEDRTGRARAPDAFERVVEQLREASGYDPGAEDEAHDELAARRTQRWAGRVVLTATLLLLVFNAVSLHSWATTLPAGWGSETVRELADLWSERLAVLGLDRPRQTIHDAYRDWKGETRGDGAE